MNLDEIDTMLKDTLADGRLSRGERRALDAALLDEATPEERVIIRSRVFDIAREALTDPKSRSTIEWIEAVVKLLAKAEDGGTRCADTSVCFSPGEDCRRAIQGFIKSTRRTLDVCVFTITDDRIADEIVRAHRRRVEVRVLTDREKSSDRGSDIGELLREGIPLAIDETDKHMHHKFAVSDASRVLTGSYNWTRSAADENQENVLVTDDGDTVRRFVTEFDRLWAKYYTR